LMGILNFPDQQGTWLALLKTTLGTFQGDVLLSLTC
jgi:hypothetical protein